MLIIFEPNPENHPVHFNFLFYNKSDYIFYLHYIYLFIFDLK